MNALNDSAVKLKRALTGKVPELRAVNYRPSKGVIVVYLSGTPRPGVIPTRTPEGFLVHTVMQTEGEDLATITAEAKEPEAR